MADPLIGKKLNQYRVERLLGRGGMGAVYQGVDEDTGNAVAIKVTARNLGDGDEVYARFEREARVAAGIHHPNVARVFDTGQAGDVRFIVMEYIDGRPLSAVAKDRGRLTLPKALDYVRQTCEGLDAAYHQGVIHRDIKPENLMLTSAGLVKIVDFGLAKAESGDSFKTATGAVMGTPHFIPPEQAMGLPTDHRADIYSLGATLYFLLAGHPPFDGDNAFTIIQKHVKDEPRSVTYYNPSVPESVNQLILRMMRKSPDDRFQTFGHLIRVIEDLQRGRRMPTMTMDVVDERAKLAEKEETRQDRRKLIAGAAVFLLLLLGALGYMSRRPAPGAGDEEAAAGDNSPLTSGKWRSETVPLLHDIGKALKEQDDESKRFENRRSRMNEGTEEE